VNSQMARVAAVVLSYFALSGTVLAQSPPSISSFSPTQRTAGTPNNFTLTLTGANFCPDSSMGSQISFNSVSRPATTPNASTSSTLISNTEIPASGPVPISLTGIGCGGLSSNTVFMTINPPLQLNPASLPNAVVGSPYNQTVTASGGTPAYAAPTPSGGAPPFTTLPGSVKFSFTPASTGSFSFSVTQLDSGGGQINPSYFIFVVQPSGVTPTQGTPQSAPVTTNFATPMQVLVVSGPPSDPSPVEGAQVTFSAPGSGPSGTFQGSPVVFTDSSGLATAPPFRANGIAGSYVVTATVSGLSTVFNLTNTVGPPASISATGGTPQSVAINTAFPTAFQATVRDASANPIPGVTVSFTAPGSGASGSFSGTPSAVTNASGVATAPAFTANSVAGSYSVSASTAGVASPAAFSLTNTPGSPASITSTGGTPQSTPVNQAFPARLQATVKDSGGNLVPGVAVTFTAPTSGPSASFGGAATVLTGSGGIAISPALTANSGAGTYTVSATVAGAPAPANFSLTNTEAPSIPPTALPVGVVGQSYSAGIAATGGAPPYNFVVISGSLPPGLALASSGSITGTPTAPGVFPALIQVTDSLQSTAAREVLIRVVGALTITTSSTLPNAFLGTPYSLIFQASGGQPAYTWSIVGGGAFAQSDKGRAAAAAGLPPGMTFNNGILSGAPTALGDFSFTVQVTDQAQRTTSKSFALTSAPSSSAPAIQVSVADLVFEGPAGGNPPALQYLAVVAANQQPLAATVELDSGSAGSAAPPWLGARFDSATTPARLAISTVQSGLVAGDYFGRVLVKYQGVQTLVVNVRFKINLTPPHLSVAPEYLRFAAIVGGPSPAEQSLLVTNSGTGGALDFTASVVDTAWLTVTPASGRTVVGSGVPLRVLVNTQGLKIGSYLGKIRVESASGGSINIPVSLFLSPNGPIISAAPLGVLFDSREGNGQASPGEITILNNGTGAINWKAELQTPQGWLRLNPASGLATPGAPGKLALSINPAALKAGKYYALVRISDPQALNSPQVALVVLNVRAANASPEADVVPSGLYFAAVSGGLAPAAQNLKVFVSSDTPLPFQAAASADGGGDWLSIGAPNGVASTQAPGQIAVSVNPSKLKAGVYTGDVSVSFSTPGIRTANITLVVLPVGASLAAPDSKGRSATGCAAGRLALNSTSLANAFSSPAGWPVSLQVRVTDDCASPTPTARVVATFSNGDPALPFSLIDPAGALFSATWAPGAAASQTSVKLTGLAQGLATATLNLTGSVPANSTPVLNSNGIINNLNPGASGAALAPGTVAQVFGGGLAPASSESGLLPLPTAVAGTQVLIGLQAAPLYYVSDGQINMQIPTELQPDRQYSILVASGAGFTLPDTITLSPVSPGLLQFAQHADFRTVTAADPVRAGETIRLYLVGMGATDQTVTSGVASPSSPLARVNVQPTVTINGRSATVLFAGLTPGSVGLYQIDLQTPEDLTAGNTAVVVTQGEAVSNTVTIPVR
jgi:uncharacterized protein (TIGR03437 family)